MSPGTRRIPFLDRVRLTRAVGAESDSFNLWGFLEVEKQLPARLGVKRPSFWNEDRLRTSEFAVAKGERAIGLD